MKRRRFLVAFASLFFTASLLFLAGHMLTIPWLMFHYEYTDSANEFFISTGSFVPLIIGLIVSFFTEKIYVYPYRQKSG